MIPRVDDIEGEPEVGKFYMVRCYLDQGVWFPITGPEHEDADILNFPHMHYHFDMRFVGVPHLRRWRQAEHRFWVTEAVVEQCMGRIQRTDIKTERTGKMEHRRMKCQRVQPDLPTLLIRSGQTIENGLLRKLEAAYKDAKMSCQTCPHRGLKLGQLPQKDGVVVCPGHGLAWRMSTGEMVSRL